MKKLMKGFVQIILIMTLVMGMSIAANAETTTQQEVKKCGKNATWTYDASTYTLTISGTGKIRSTYEWTDMNIKHIQINSGITTIGYEAFSHMKTLDTISIPSSVKKIGYNAFYRSSIKSVTISSSVTNISSSTFYNCKKLTTVNWYASEIPNYTFYGCKSLKTINVNRNLNYIGYYAFARTSIKTFNMPDSVTRIDSSAFAYCPELEKLTLSKNLKTIPAYFASGSKKLKDITINNGVSEISRNAFSNSYVEELEIPDSVKTIQTRAFEDANSLKKVKLPNKLVKIRDSVFEGCKKLETVNIGKNVKYIGECAFAECPKLKAVVIPGNVQVIGYKAFENSGVKKVIIKSGVKTIDYWAFQDCDKLKSISISDTVTTLCTNALVDCDKLTNIKVDSNNKKYASKDGCLFNKSETTLLVVPAGKKGVFNLPSSVSKVDSMAFYGCSQITSISASGNSHFKTVDGILYNSSMKTLISCPSSKKGTISIPSTVTRIEESAFQQSKAEYINIPDSVTSIGYCAFEYCKNLKSIKIPGSVEKISNAAFWGCENLKKVTIEKGVKKISRNAFHGCEKLRKVIVPTSVSTISKSAFSDCGYVTFYCKKSSYAMSFAVKRYYLSYKMI